jgi:hypothetical protein
MVREMLVRTNKGKRIPSPRKGVFFISAKV